MNAPTEQQGKGIATVLIAVAVIIIAVLAFKQISGLFGSITSKLGLTDSKETADAKEAVATGLTKEVEKADDSAFSPALHKKAKPGTWKKGMLLTQKSTDDLAQQIYKAIGYITDSPEQIFGAIKQCRSKGQISFLASRFQDIYKKDLLDWLGEKLDTTSQKMTLAAIVAYANKLPLGFTE